MKLSCAALLALICSVSLRSSVFAFLPNAHKLIGINIADKGRISPTEKGKNNHNDRRITVLQKSGNSDISKPAKSLFDTTVTPVIAAGIAITAFSFQVFGIFPWHARLQDGFESVKVVNEQIVKEEDMIQNKIDTVQKLQAEINMKLKLRQGK